ncbi:MAG: hypothetical protein J3R72DRAFT_55807 [Linnemannia gamsii]|nr:MAG: hypothetical protein J3R72DRAFT_55807 [Linnemannia gamsii]
MHILPQPGIRSREIKKKKSLIKQRHYALTKQQTKRDRTFSVLIHRHLFARTFSLLFLSFVTQLQHFLQLTSTLFTASKHNTMQQRLHPRQLSSSTMLFSNSPLSPTFTISYTTQPIPLNTGPSTGSPSADALIYPVVGAVAGTTFIVVCVAAYIAYQVRAVNRDRKNNVLLKSNKDKKHHPRTDLEKAMMSRRGVQSNSNSSTLRSQLIHPSLLQSNLSPSPSPPPGYTRGPQSIVLGIDQIENGKNNQTTGLMWAGESGWETARSPQDHLRQEQLDRVMKLHRKQMKELQALLQRHMLNNTQLLGPHAIVHAAVDDGDGESDGGHGVVGRNGRRRGQGKVGGRKQRSHQSSRSTTPGFNPDSHSPQGIDSPMVQPDDAVRGPEEILYPVPSRALGRPSLVTHGSLGLVSDWVLEEEEEEGVEGIDELRPEDRSMLVDCFEKINAHYERQFRIAESEILHGSS